MKISIEYDRCEGHGRCVDAAPEIFELDDQEGRVVLLEQEPPEELRGKASAAVDACPVAALHVSR
jgi:ferredoxin